MDKTSGQPELKALFFPRNCQLFTKCPEVSSWNKIFTKHKMYRKLPDPECKKKSSNVLTSNQNVWKVTKCSTSTKNVPKTLCVRSSRMVRASDCQCQSRSSPGFYPSILRQSGIWGGADEAVWNIVEKNLELKTTLTLVRMALWAPRCRMA